MSETVHKFEEVTAVWHASSYPRLRQTTHQKVKKSHALRTHEMILSDKFCLRGNTPGIPFSNQALTTPSHHGT